MKIAFIGQKGIPGQTGGVERHVEFLARHLSTLGQEILVYNRAVTKDQEMDNYQGIKLIYLPFIDNKNLASITHTFLASLDVLKRKPDIIHYHGVGPSLLIWIPKLFLRKARLVATLHSFDYDNDKWSYFAKLMLRLGESIMCKYADEVIVLTPATQDYVLKKYHRSSQLIPNGTELLDSLNNQGEQALKSFNLEPKNYIFTASRLIRLKGIQYLIAAYKNLATDKKLVIAGEGEYQKTLEELARGDDRIIFLGNQQGDTLRHLYANAYLFVQSSEMEGLSLSLLEAMGHASACLASDIPGNRVALAETGLYFENRNINDLQKKLKQLLDNEAEVKTLAASSYRRAVSEFNWPKVVKQTNDLYQKLIERKNN